MAHITGGGFTDNIPRVLPKTLGVRIDLTAVPVLPVFKWLAKEGDIAELEMLRTFNCGIGMIAVVDRDKAVDVMKVLSDNGERAVLLGEVTEATGTERVVYDGHLDLTP
jgi:phosphoribosylformylglycinamidine cyclo-ligase